MADRNGKSGYDDVLDQARDLIRDADSAGEGATPLWVRR